MRISRALSAASVIVLGAAGCSSGGTVQGGPAVGGTRTVEVTMIDNAFQPDRINVTKGESVTLRFKNQGMVRHEAVLGDDAVQERHEAEMTMSTAPGAMDPGTTAADATAGMAHGGDPTGAPMVAVTVEPGQTGALTHTFTETGPVVVGCHQPGHWQAGMKATTTVG